MFNVFSFPPGDYVGTLNLITSVPSPSILTLQGYTYVFLFLLQNIDCGEHKKNEQKKNVKNVRTYKMSKFLS